MLHRAGISIQWISLGPVFYRGWRNFGAKTGKPRDPTISACYRILNNSKPLKSRNFLSARICRKSTRTPPPRDWQGWRREALQAARDGHTQYCHCAAAKRIPGSRCCPLHEDCREYSAAHARPSWAARHSERSKVGSRPRRNKLPNRRQG